MTWIVGVPMWIGRCVLVSDIRVSFSDGSHKDCLQKLHVLGGGIIGGFAGSVRTGFAVMDALHRALVLPPEKGWVLPRIAHTSVRRLIRRIYRASSADEQGLGCEVMLAGVHPTEPAGSPFPSPALFVFRSPDFTPFRVTTGRAQAIGAGAVVERYRAEIEELVADFAFTEASLMAPEGPAVMMANVMRLVATQLRTPGVSPMMHVGVVERRVAKVEPVDLTVVRAHHGTTERIVTPPLATTWSEFQAQCRDAQIKAEAAVA